MFQTIEDIIQLADNSNDSISEIMMKQEEMISGRSRLEIWSRMESIFDVMERAIEKGTTENVVSRSGLSGGSAVKVAEYLELKKTLSGPTILSAVKNALATSEVNAAMGIICATPTAGAAGVVPGCLFSARDTLSLTKEQQIRFLFTTGAIGYVIANQATVSGAVGGCQAEIGSATAMAAGALVEAAGGSAMQSAHAISFALQSMLGLVCDPVAGLVEIPCIQRNATGASIAMVAADMALAGCEFPIPADEVIEAMYNVGKTIPYTLRETALGGLAKTKTGKSMAQRISSDKQ
ncbi:L-serine dehydratase, iron-sulfur-dependent subunit alpha [Desulfuribacillus stibiiarsenatis]|uniref:L-serine dehydratase n=1 Tax=Desulfuribacillus stibiiarsenatis TaxID=1390249 RepID=A0A1E5L9S0_9FIRM|nr:L-serine dehydratase, iron-sulfur-dependent subunit alpha [Desulfuribacillus stibiiarsenatis]